MVDARHSEDVEDHVGARDEQHREEVEDETRQAVRHPARALSDSGFNDMFLRSLIYSFYLAVAHGQAWDEPTSVNAQGKQHNGRGYTEPVGCVAREIETLYVERDS